MLLAPTAGWAKADSADDDLNGERVRQRHPFRQQITNVRPSELRRLS
jgi:hypothetical protein